MEFYNAVVEHTNGNATTTNGARTNLSSLNACVDFFFLAGASRGKDITKQFEAAYKEDRDTALRILLWLRDAREGAGERQTFRTLWKHLHKISEFDARTVLWHVPELGRWDDVLEAEGDVKVTALSLIKRALEDKDGLCAKWMPRKGPVANELRKFLGLTPKTYRKLLVGLTNVVETKMCSQMWDTIEFGKLPSVASARYQKAFSRNASEAYQAYKDSLVKGEAKVNAGAIFPHDVLKGLTNGDETVATAQWEALPNYLSEGGDFILPMSDVSSSMTCSVGGNPKLTCMDMSIALGLYLADKQQGPFKGLVLTFDSTPTFVDLKRGSLRDKYSRLKHAAWGGSTNIEGAFRRILEVAKKANINPENMPKKLLILSDMEFNSACGHHGYRNASALDMVHKAYADAGYAVPQIVFWNLNARPGNVPAKSNDEGVALVSGYSPTILKAILAGSTITPYGVMMEAVGKDRYKV